MKISIALCTYNGAQFLREQLDSIAAQTRLPDEIVVCDDCSSDATAAIVREFAAAAPFAVRLFVNDKNLRTVKNFERAIALCGGDIIFLADQDDVWLRDKIKIFYDRFAAAPEVGLVFCDADVVDENLQPTEKTNWQLLDFDARRQEIVSSDGAFDYLLKNVAVFGCLMAFRARYKDLVLPIRDNLARVIHDNWVAILIAAAARIEPVPQRLVKYRQHAAQQIGHRAGEETNFVQNALHKHDYDSEIELLAALHERLMQNAARFPADDAIKMLASRLKHFEQRRAMRSGNAARKVRLIAEELLSARYSAHTSGWRSALKDLLTA